MSSQRSDTDTESTKAVEQTAKCRWGCGALLRSKDYCRNGHTQ